MASLLFLGPGVFIDDARMIFPGPAVVLSEALGMLDQVSRPVRSNVLDEVVAADLEDAINEPFELVGPTDGQVAFEDDPIERGQRPTDQTGERTVEGG